MLLDIAVLMASAAPLQPTFPADRLLAWFLCWGGVIAIVGQRYGLYRAHPLAPWWRDMLDLARATFVSSFVLAAVLYGAALPLPRRLALLSGVWSFAVLLLLRSSRRHLIQWRRAHGQDLRRVLIVGAGSAGRQLNHYLRSHRDLGYEVMGIIDQSQVRDAGVPGTAELPLLIRKHFIDEVFIALPWRSPELHEAAQYARSLGVTVRVLPDAADGLAWGAPRARLGPVPVIDLHRERVPAVRFFLKRAIDLFSATLLLVLFAPVMALVALAIKLDSPGSVFYAAPRVGRRGKVFRCVKFRSMVCNADALKAELRKQNERRGPFFKMADDPRLTTVGRFLRRYSLDELPQLWNVLCGDMSMVGPRPHPIDDYQLYGPDNLRRLDVTPGLTGLWQVMARRDPSWERGMALDIEYIEKWNLWMDFQILLKTVPVMFEGNGQ